MAKITVDTRQFELSHGRKPHGEGLWIFATPDGRTHPGLEFGGRYVDTRRALPGGDWLLLP